MMNGCMFRKVRYLRVPGIRMLLLWQERTGTPAVGGTDSAAEKFLCLCSSSRKLRSCDDSPGAFVADNRNQSGGPLVC